MTLRNVWTMSCFKLKWLWLLLEVCMDSGGSRSVSSKSKLPTRIEESSNDEESRNRSDYSTERWYNDSNSSQTSPFEHKKNHFPIFSLTLRKKDDTSTMDWIWFSNHHLCRSMTSKPIEESRSSMFQRSCKSSSNECNTIEQRIKYSNRMRIWLSVIPFQWIVI